MIPNNLVILVGRVFDCFIFNIAFSAWKPARYWLWKAPLDQLKMVERLPPFLLDVFDKAFLTNSLNDNFPERPTLKRFVSVYSISPTRQMRILVPVACSCPSTSHQRPNRGSKPQLIYRFDFCWKISGMNHFSGPSEKFFNRFVFSIVKGKIFSGKNSPLNRPAKTTGLWQ